MKRNRQDTLILGFTLQEALCLSFCATFIIIAKAVLRLHLHVTGHSMVLTMFFLLLARGCVPRKGAAIFTGLVAGILCVILGMGAKSGPLAVFKFLLPGLCVDIVAWFYPRLSTNYAGCIITGAFAAGLRVVVLTLVELMVGMDYMVILQHMAVGTVMNMVFGGLGGSMVPSVVRRLDAAGLIRHIDADG